MPKKPTRGQKTMRKERTTGNPKSTVSARAAAQNKRNMKRSIKKGY